MPCPMPLRDLPSVDALVRSLPATGLPRSLVIECARTAIARAREQISRGTEEYPQISRVGGETSRCQTTPIRHQRHRRAAPHEPGPGTARPGSGRGSAGGSSLVRQCGV